MAILDELLNAIREPVRQKNAEQLRNILLVEPPLPENYQIIVQELHNKYPKGRDAELSKICEDIAPPHPEGGSSWGAFAEVVRRYLVFLRDFDQNNYLSIYNTLQALLNQCNIALSDSTYGVVILPTVLYLTKVLAKFAVTLDKNPDIVAQQQQGQSVGGGGDNAGEKIGFVESSANVVRDAFIKCLADKSGSAGLAGPGRRGKPENKRVGIYQTANFCLRLLFQCRKLRNAEQMFVSIDNQSPPLSFYPASQQVTFLYYLGRYHFANNHFYRAQVALQAAYNKCHRDAVKHRRLILIYLITSNMILGRFPSTTLMSRPEAAGLDQYFLPLCQLIRQGDIVGFLNLLSISNPNAAWFLHHRILLQLRDRCEVLVWRSLVRRVFIATGHTAEDGRGIPFLRLSHIQAAVQTFEILSKRQESNNNFSLGTTHPPSPSPEEIDPEFSGISEAALQSSFNLDGGFYVEDETQKSQIDTTLTPPPSPSSALSISEVEAIVSSLIQQDLLTGFITHDNPRFAIPGASKRGGYLKAGFPNIWHTISNKVDREEGVPGWVREKSGGIGFAGSGGLGGGGFMPGGRVVSLSDARPVGAN